MEELISKREVIELIQRHKYKVPDEIQERENGMADAILFNLVKDIKPIKAIPLDEISIMREEMLQQRKESPPLISLTNEERKFNLAIDRCADIAYKYIERCKEKWENKGKSLL